MQIISTHFNKFNLHIITPLWFVFSSIFLIYFYSSSIEGSSICSTLRSLGVRYLAQPLLRLRTRWSTLSTFTIFLFIKLRSYVIRGLQLSLYRFFTTPAIFLQCFQFFQLFYIIFSLLFFWCVCFSSILNLLYSSSTPLVLLFCCISRYILFLSWAAFSHSSCLLSPLCFSFKKLHESLIF